MGLRHHCYLAFRVIIVCIIWHLANVVVCRPSLEEKYLNCTECCSFSACIDFDFVNASRDTNNIEQLCSKLDNATVATCFSPKFVSDCVPLKRIVDAFPSDKIFESFKASCEQKKYFADLQNIMKCILTNDVGANTLNTCMTSYANSLKDPKSDICEAMKTLNTCVREIMIFTKCVVINSELYRLVIKFQNNPLCS